MKMKGRILTVCSIVAVCLLMVPAFWGCKSGGGSSSSGISAEGGFGKVGILLTDGPADEYKHIWVTVTEVSLLPSGDEDDGGAVVIFSSEAGYRFDLLQYRDDDFLLTLNENVPAGTYAKVRLKAVKVEAEGGPCSEMDIKIPGGKIDLAPRNGSIVVEDGASLYVRLDIDANKSINLHEAGSSGKCVFRPVVFVDVLSKASLPSCPTFVKGEVSVVYDTDHDGLPEFFTIKRDHACLGTMNVKIDEDTLVFTEEGTFGPASEIEVGSEVTVRGILGHGCIDASLVILGDSLVLKGTVKDPVTASGFGFLPDDDEEIEGQIDVALDDETLMVRGCNDPVSVTSVKAGMRAVVIGKYDTEEGELIAAIALFEPKVSGTVTGVVAIDGGFRVSVDTGDGVVYVDLKGAYTICIEGDGLLDTEDITALFMIGCRIRVIEGDGCIEARITPVTVQGEVTAIDRENRTITVGTTKVKIMPLATGVDISAEGEDSLIPFSDIEKGDTITCFGFDAVSGRPVDFYAYAYLVRD